MLPKPNAVETYLHDVDHMEDHELEAKYYTSGIAAPRYPMPALYDDYSNPNVWDCALGYHVNFG